VAAVLLVEGLPRVALHADEPGIRLDVLSTRGRDPHVQPQLANSDRGGSPRAYVQRRRGVGCLATTATEHYRGHLCVYDAAASPAHSRAPYYCVDGSVAPVCRVPAIELPCTVVDPLGSHSVVAKGHSAARAPNRRDNCLHPRCGIHRWPCVASFLCVALGVVRFASWCPEEARSVTPSGQLLFEVAQAKPRAVSQRPRSRHLRPTCMPCVTLTPRS